jgi:hypothetical protein
VHYRPLHSRRSRFPLFKILVERGKENEEKILLLNLLLYVLFAWNLIIPCCGFALVLIWIGFLDT